jgi:hypothetical protein
MSVRNRYNQFTDTPVEEAWFLKFNTLFLPTDHRKILNRQPEVRFIDFAGISIVLIVFDMKVMAN